MLVAACVGVSSTPAAGPGPAVAPASAPVASTPSQSTAPSAGSKFARDPALSGELGYVAGPDGGVASGPCEAPDGGPPCLRGDIDKEIIRRIIRRHVGDVRGCYEPELAKTPQLGGRILVQFTIAAKGDVTSSSLAGSTMHAPLVESCIVKAVQTWQFPALLHGGTMNVTYPFTLSPAVREP